MSVLVLVVVVVTDLVWFGGGGVESGRFDGLVVGVSNLAGLII
jgi:hypothetical protein